MVGKGSKDIHSSLEEGRRFYIKFGIRVLFSYLLELLDKITEQFDTEEKEDISQSTNVLFKIFDYYKDVKKMNLSSQEKI